MKSTNLFSTIICILLAGILQAQMTIKVTSVPQLTPLLDDIYLAGTFNNWNPADEGFKMSRSGAQWVYSLIGKNGSNISFKFTRGISWNTVEGNALGGFVPDRTLQFQDGAEVELTILGWEDLPGQHSVTPGVRILDMDFPIPQLNRTRRIWISFPQQYETTDQHFPVLYMHDGQNLFDQATSFSGEWQVDETQSMNFVNCVEPVIVVGIDNGGIARLDEYSPWLNTTYNDGGEGALYAQFVAQTLKPFIDQHFRTKPEVEHTAVGGSSLGALISMYMMSAYPGVFGKGAIVSPAFWFNPEIFNYVQNNPINTQSRVYFICGGSEGGSVVTNMQQMYNTVSTQVSAANLNYTVVVGGQHNEASWSQQFPGVYSFLFDCTTGISETDHSIVPIIYPNPANDSICITWPNFAEVEYVELYDSNGKLVLRKQLQNDHSVTLNITALRKGLYTITGRSRDQQLGTTKFIKQ